ncbi:MAG: DNA mismatch repair protein MutS [Rhodospirillaceae bacterium]|nr:DNA mismatch repair protein MutS [Rhodospirillaceae bacterium]
MLAQYFEIKNRHNNYLLFYRMGDFYELFFDDAIMASDALDITLTKRGKQNDKDIPMCGVPVHAADVYLARLIRKGFKVAVCEQVEKPEEARKRGSKSVVKREVVRIVTPGTVTEESLLEATENNFLASLSFVQNDIGLAWVDISTGLFQTQKCGIEQLGAALSRILPTEILISDVVFQKFSEEKYIQSQLVDWKELFTPLAHSFFDSSNGGKRLQKIYGVSSLESFGPFSRAEVAAGGALVEYLNLTQQGKIPRLLLPQQWNAGEVLEIDSATRNNLELIRTIGGSRKGSLLKTIDKTLTSAGSRLLSNWMSAPPTNPVTINKRLDRITCFYENERLRRSLREIIKTVPDVERALSRLSADRAGPRDLIAIRNALSKTNVIKLELLCKDVGLAQIADEFKTHIQDLDGNGPLVDLLTSALADDPPILIRDGGYIASGFDAELDRLRSLKEESRSLIIALQQRYAEEMDINSIKIKHNNILGFFVEVTSLHSEKLMSHPTFIHRQTMANSGRFTTVELSELERDISQSAQKSLHIEEQCFNNLRNEVLVHHERILASAFALAEIDVFLSLSELAVEQRYVRPIITTGKDFEISDGRHPVVEVFCEAGEQFISNSCELKTENRLWLLTGPNMAGKSTFLRQNALIVLMAQMGSYVPASYAKIGVIDRLFSRVGAADDLARGRSTFMVEMVETASILNQATDRSFVILDEIGRGTATFDGLSIAWATVEHLHHVVRCRTLFATHYHELTNLSSTLEAMKCYSMKIKEWNDDIIFLHEVVEGVAHRSYGTHVAKLAGLPENVIQRAKIVLKELEESEKSSAIDSLAEDLPLFKNAVPEQSAEKEMDNKLKDYLLDIKPDSLTPRDALEIVYELRALIDD